MYSSEYSLKIFYYFIQVFILKICIYIVVFMISRIHLHGASPVFFQKNRCGPCDAQKPTMNYIFLGCFPGRSGNKYEKM